MMFTLHPKMAAGGVAGALAFLVVLIAGHWFTVSAETSSAVTVIVTALAAYLAPWLPATPKSKTHPDNK